MFAARSVRRTLALERLNRNADKPPQARLGSGAWSLEDDRVERLMAKLRERGVPLAQYAGCKPIRGILTGFNEAFLIDEATRSRLMREDARSGEVLHRFVRGANVDRWAAEWDGQWMIVLPSSSDRAWPWTTAADPESVFSQTFPALYRWFKPFEAKLKIRSDKGRFWWELRPCAYYHAFLKPKIVYQVIQFHPCYSLDERGFFLNDKCFAIPSGDPWLLAVLNSPAMWWHNTRFLPHMKDEALTPLGERMLRLPIALPSQDATALAARLVPTAVADVAANHQARRALIDALRVQYAVEKAGEALANFHRLDADAFIREVSKRRTKGLPKLRPAELGDLRGLHEAESLPIIRREQAIARIERQLSDLVNEAYGLTDKDIATLRDTAPPRMPPGLPPAP